MTTTRTTKSHSELMAAQPQMVTTYGKMGSIGIGYLLAGQVWRTTGSALCILATDDIDPMVRYDIDGGAGYHQAVRQLFGGR